jgi:hypothetical protein
MSDTMDDFTREYLRRYVKTLPPEEQMKGLTLEERLAGLTPEERAKMLELIEQILSKQSGSEPKG